MNLSKFDNSIPRYWIIAAAFCIVQLVLHLISATNYELHRDEMLYFNMGNHPAFGYLTVPPVTGLLAWVIKLFFGYSVFGIRLIPAILGSATLLIIAKTVKDMGGGIIALVVASFTFILTPGFLLIFSLFTPNAVEIFLWSVLIYLFFRLVKTENPKVWIWIGMAAGFAFNTKYSVVFPLTGFFISMLLFRKFKLLFSPWILAGLATGIILIFPNIIWQYNHNWPVLYHMQELQKTQLDNLNYLNFFTDLFSLNSALLLVWLFGITALVFQTENRVGRFMALSILTVFILFVLLKGKAYYAMGLIPFLISAGAYYFEKNYVKKSITISAFAALAFYSMLSLPFVLPLLSFDKLDNYSTLTKKWVPAPFMRWEDGKEYPISQVFADMTGWEELAAIVAGTYHSLSEYDKMNCTIFCQRNYGYAGALHFYGHQYRLPEPVTFLESYVFWAPDTIPDEPFIYVYYNSDELQSLFNSIVETGAVQNPWFRENGLKVFLCTKPETNVQEVYRGLAKNEKSKFQKTK